MFQGFSPETIDFLWGIRLNNNREWFLAHKQDYVKTLYEPMKQLGAELFQPFLDKPGNILKVSRIYRDARLHYPVPYKESLWICIRQDVPWWAENPCLFFEIRPECISYGFVWFRPKAAAMEAFRKHLEAFPKEFPKLVRQVQSELGISVCASCYRKPKTTRYPDLEPFFAWKNDIHCICTEQISPEIFGPALACRVTDMFRKLMPLYEYCNRFHE